MHTMDAQYQFVMKLWLSTFQKILYKYGGGGGGGSIMESP